MSVRRIAKIQPEGFAFTEATQPDVDFWLAKYPADRQRSAVIPLLWLAQKQDGWVSEPAMRHIGEMLDIAYIRVYEVATFYTMFHLQPVGKHHLQVCGTTPCMLRGSGDLIAVCKSRIGKAHHVTADGLLSWEEMECLGACANAPVAMIHDYYHEDLTGPMLEDLIDRLQRGEAVTPGSAIGRQTSAPEGGALTLVDNSLFDGSLAKPIKGGLPNAAAAAPVLSPQVPVSPSPATKSVNEGSPAAKQVRKATIIGQKRPVTEAEPAVSSRSAVAVKKPKMLKAPRKSGADNLKEIKGVGPKLEAVLQGMGVYHFDQIAAWTSEEVEWVDNALKFKGRIARDDWQKQAKILAAGGETEFSRRVAKGDVPSSES
jgi:NADH-quinone oxidoreductase subunit E